MRRLTTILSALVTLAACSGSTTNMNDNTGSDGGSDAASSVTAAQASADAATAFCARIQSCAPAYLSIGYGDVATCNTRFAKSILPSIGANGSAATPAMLETCAKAIANASCGDLLSRNLPAECRKPGTLADGSACATDDQCLNMRCKVAPNAVCGTCGSHAAAGASCAVDEDCDFGAKCVNGTCAAYGKQGDPCSATRPCRADLACRSGSCAAPAATGDACTAFEECDVLHGVGCNPVTKKCEAFSFAQPGNACGFVSSQIVVCQGPGGDCVGATQQNPKGTCKAPAADGAACDNTNGPLCASPAVCMGGICTLPDPAACK